MNLEKVFAGAHSDYRFIDVALDGAYGCCLVKSPFPGLDPYLQKFWRSVHHRLITYAGDILVGQLPHPLKLFIEERIVFETDALNECTPIRGYAPDVAVIEAKFESETGSTSGESSGIAVAEPILIRFPPQPVAEGYIEIRDSATGGQVITTLEFLSPSNKVKTGY